MFISVDIKELKLLGLFDHPNIVRFVRGPTLLLLMARTSLTFSTCSLESAYRKTRGIRPS
jgi:hypothetical protein